MSDTDCEHLYFEFMQEHMHALHTHINKADIVYSFTFKPCPLSDDEVTYIPLLHQLPFQPTQLHRSLQISKEMLEAYNDCNASATYIHSEKFYNLQEEQRDCIKRGKTKVDCI